VTDFEALIDHAGTEVTEPLVVDEFPWGPEYSMSGWFRCVEVGGGYFLLFRVTSNDPTINANGARLGDRTLSVWVTAAHYHVTTYTYVNNFGGGNANSL
jgi:hypothetical protein